MSASSTSENLFSLAQSSNRTMYRLNSVSDDATSSSNSRFSNSTAYSQLTKAITDGNLGLVKQMIDYGLDVNFIYDTENNYSFLHLACLMGHSKLIKYLLDSGANVNVVTNDGQQPIDFIESDDPSTIAYMLLRMNSK